MHETTLKRGVFCKIFDELKGIEKQY